MRKYLSCLLLSLAGCATPWLGGRGEFVCIPTEDMYVAKLGDRLVVTKREPGDTPASLAARNEAMVQAMREILDGTRAPPTPQPWPEMPACPR